MLLVEPVQAANSHGTGLELGVESAALGPARSHREAREWSLVLQSAGIPHQARHVHGAEWVIVVDAALEARGREVLNAYARENQNWPPREQRQRARTEGLVWPVLVFFAALGLFAGVTGPSANHSSWFSQGSSVSGQVMQGELWRAATALTLHADSTHVLGNMISGTIFASAVARRLGPGGALLGLVAAGTLGNLANAAYYTFVEGNPAHGSIGASTAVFGAIGILATTQIAIDRFLPRVRNSWVSFVAPLVGGFALLGALGAGTERTDLYAHLFGLIAGALVGLAGYWAVRPTRQELRLATVPVGARPASSWQWASAALAVGVILSSWQAAFFL